MPVTSIAQSKEDVERIKLYALIEMMETAIRTHMAIHGGTLVKIKGSGERK